MQSGCQHDTSVELELWKFEKLFFLFSFSAPSRLQLLILILVPSSAIRLTGTTVMGLKSVWIALENFPNPPSSFHPVMYFLFLELRKHVKCKSFWDINITLQIIRHLFSSCTINNNNNNNSDGLYFKCIDNTESFYFVSKFNTWLWYSWKILYLEKLSETIDSDRHQRTTRLKDFISGNISDSMFITYMTSKWFQKLTGKISYHT